MIPRFTAQQALQPARRSYRTIPSAVPHRTIQAQAGPASGVLLGIACVGNVLTVIAVDIDENGQITNWHNVDEIGSC
jgi:hypothetical protein